MRIFLTRLLWAFDITEEEGRGLDWESLKTFNLFEKKPLELRIKLRSDVMFKDRHY